MAPSGCPARTRLPSATPSDTSVPAALARTTAVRGATSGPENSMRIGSATSCGRTTSCCVNSSATSFFLSPASLPLLARDTTTTATPAMISAATPPVSHSFRMGLPFLS